MKIERTETSIRLIPESEWDKINLKELRKKSIEKMRFQDDWERSGYLELVFKIHPWDKKY
jgi:hypothetical protein